MVTVDIYRYEALQATFTDQDSDFCALRYLLSHQPHSTDHALRYEGWKVKVTDQETGTVEYWKPYTNSRP